MKALAEFKIGNLSNGWNATLQVQQTLKLLDPWTRRVWNYVKYGYSIKEIARRLDLTEFQVEFRYRRRLARLRDYLRRRGGTAA